MNASDWALLTVVIVGDGLEINGVNVWKHKWRHLDCGALEVPHPNYPDQRHTLWPYVIESDNKAVMFCAGELSNCVWCFYVPKDR